jgi:hypothetical protein
LLRRSEQQTNKSVVVETTDLLGAVGKLYHCESAAVDRAFSALSPFTCDI